MTSFFKLSKQKIPRQERELRVITNPIVNNRLCLLDSDDYQAPLTAHSLLPNSKWIIVRNNLHKIRSWGGIDASKVDHRHQDWYILFQTRRELRRAHERIQQIEHHPEFVPVRYFNLPTDPKHNCRYDVSHVQPSDVLYYGSFGHEPIALQPLLYYFSKECIVPYNSIFRPFLSDVCSVLYRNQRRRNRTSLYRKVALIITIIVFIMISLMLFSLIISALKTTSDLRNMYQNDPNEGGE